jgi:FkbM family methyltransferase
MKKVGHWYFPDGEQHLIDWMASPKGHMVINGRDSYQGKKQLRAMDFVPLDKRRTAIDVGAHIGLWSFNLAHWFNSVESFEPVALHRECFRVNLFDAINVKLHPYALGDREDMISIHTADTSSGDSWVKGKGEIPMKTLDSFGFEDVDFIKIDCEGYEEFVLRGAEALIEAWKPVIVVEQKRDMATKFGLKPLGAVKFLIDRGYRTAQEISGDFLMVPR